MEKMFNKDFQDALQVIYFFKESEFFYLVYV